MKNRYGLIRDGSEKKQYPKYQKEILTMLDFDGNEYQRGFDEAEFILTPEELAENKLKKESFNGDTDDDLEGTGDPD